MYRSLAATFSLSIIVLSIVGVAYPDSWLAVIMNTNVGIAILRILLCSLLFTYSVLPKFRYGLPRKTLVVAGAAIMWFFMVSLYIDKGPFPGPLDLFFGIEGSVLAAIATLDFERPKAVQRFMPARLTPRLEWVSNLFAAVKQIRPPAPPSRQKPA